MKWVEDVTPWWVGERVVCPKCGRAFELTKDDATSGVLQGISDTIVVTACQAGCTQTLTNPALGFAPFGNPDADPTVETPLLITVYKPALPTRIAEGPSTELSDAEMQALQDRASKLWGRAGDTVSIDGGVFDEAGDQIGEAGPAATIIGPGEELSPYTEDADAEEGTPEWDGPFRRWMTKWFADEEATIRVALTSEPFADGDPANQTAAPIAASFDADDPALTSVNLPAWEEVVRSRDRLAELNRWAQEVRKTQDPDAVFFSAPGSSMPDHLECPNLGICMELPAGMTP